MNKYKRKDNKRLSNIYDSMKQRCLYKKSKSYKYYKDVIICNEWINSFDNFCEWALYNGYSENLTLDRINNLEGYTPSNCRWATMKTQCNNRKNNRMVIYEGKEYTLANLEKILNICQKKIRSNLERGYNIEDIIKISTYLKISEVSYILNISKRQIQTLHKNKKLIPDFINKKGDRYYKLENIKNYKKEVKSAKT